MTDLEPPQEKEDEATTLLPAQLIRDGTTAATTQLLRAALARLDNEPGVPGSQVEGRTQPTHSQLHQKSMAPPYQERILDNAIQAWSDILDRCAEEIESLVHHLE